jgi:xanthine dehydrogenase accessory factor
VTLPTETEVLTEAARALREQGRAALCQIVRTEGSTPGKAGWKLLVRPDGSCCGNLGGGAFEALVRRDASQRLSEARPASGIRRYYLTEEAQRDEATGMVCGGLVEVFMEVLRAKPLLVVCGGGPVGQALVRNGKLCGFEALVADDRQEFRRPELFPTGTLLPEVGSEYAEDFLVPHAERDLFVAIVSRCWETDMAALTSVLRQRPQGLRYLGLMGSTRKIDRVRREVESLGLDLRGTDLKAPIGLPIGGETPGELAVAILAEMIQTRAQQAGPPDEAE